MIEEIKFKKGFSFHKEFKSYEVLATPTTDHPVYRVRIDDKLNEVCLEKYLTYTEIVYIIFDAE